MSLFIRPLCHFLQFFYNSPCQISTTFKVAVSHFGFNPCGALVVLDGDREFIKPYKRFMDFDDLLDNSCRYDNWKHYTNV